jgi:two-component system, response regulator RegA
LELQTLQRSEEALVVIVDDDEIFRNRLCRAFTQRNWTACGVSTGDEAISFAREAGPDLAVVDLKLPGEGGLEIVRRLREADSTVKIVMLTGYGSIATALSAIRLGADHYVSKPADVDQILAVYENLLQGDASAMTAEPTNVPSLARVEWEHIQRVLTDCGGNISQTAKVLGLHRRSLQRKLDKYPPRR